MVMLLSYDKTVKVRRRTKSLMHNQSGVVAIFSVLIIMSILSVLVIGFTTITRRAQRSTLDNQLSTQAFYAAESGINDAVRALALNPSLTKSDCELGGPAGAFNYTFNTSLNVGYSCVLIDSVVDNQLFDNVSVIGTDRPVMTLVKCESCINFNTLVFEWDSASSPLGAIPNVSTTFSPPFTSASDWGSQVGVLRVDVVSGSTDFERGSLVGGSYVFMLYPNTSGTALSVQSTTAEKGSVGYGDCSATTVGFRCTATVTLAGALSDDYILRMQSYYNPTRVRLSIRDSAGNPLRQREGQAIVDVTGRAVDVFRRVQVRVPISGLDSYNSGIHAPFSILSGDTLCKRLEIIGSATSVVPSAPSQSCEITE